MTAEIHDLNVKWVILSDVHVYIYTEMPGGQGCLQVRDERDEHCLKNYRHTRTKRLQTHLARVVVYRCSPCHERGFHRPLWGDQTLLWPTCSLFPFPVPTTFLSGNKLFPVLVSRVWGTHNAGIPAKFFSTWEGRSASAGSEKTTKATMQNLNQAQRVRTAPAQLRTVGKTNVL